MGGIVVDWIWVFGILDIVWGLEYWWGGFVWFDGGIVLMGVVKFDSG